MAAMGKLVLAMAAAVMLVGCGEQARPTIRQEAEVIGPAFCQMMARCQSEYRPDYWTAERVELCAERHVWGVCNSTDACDEAGRSWAEIDACAAALGAMGCGPPYDGYPAACADML